MAGDANAATAVTMVFPPQPRLVRMARLASSALATVAGADVDTIDDIKIAVDEVCASLIEAGDGSDVTVGLHRRRRSLRDRRRDVGRAGPRS